MKIRVKYHVLCIMGFLLLISPLILNTFPISLVHAAESSPSADIAAKLKDFQKSAASKAAQLKELMTKKLQNKAYIGTIESRSENSLTLSTESGPKIVSINQDTVIPKKSVSSGDFVAALGDSDEIGVLTAKKIVWLSTLKSEPKTYLWGQIISISDKLLTLKTKDFKNVAVVLTVPSKVKINDIVILTGRNIKNDIFEAGFVHIIPSEKGIKPKKTATPSAQISTKSAAPKPTSKPSSKPASR